MVERTKPVGGRAWSTSRSRSPTGSTCGEPAETFTPETEVLRRRDGARSGPPRRRGQRRHAAALTVFPPLRVGVLSTGDELVEGDAPLRPGQIRESNRPMLLALVRRAGCEPIDLGLVPDDEAALTDVLRRGASECDALISSGGVSMGDFDMVKAVLDTHRGHDVDADRDQAIQAVRLRSHRRAHRCSACPATPCPRSCPSSCWPVPRCAR